MKRNLEERINDWDIKLLRLSFEFATLMFALLTLTGCLMQWPLPNVAMFFFFMLCCSYASKKLRNT